MLTKETMNKFLQWMKDNSDDAYKDKLAYGVRGRVSKDCHFVQTLTVYHASGEGNHKLLEGSKYFHKLLELFKQEKLCYSIYTLGAYYTEVFLYDPTYGGRFFEPLYSAQCNYDDEFSFSSCSEFDKPSRWQTRLGNRLNIYTPINYFTEVAR